MKQSNAVEYLPIYSLGIKMKPTHMEKHSRKTNEEQTNQSNTTSIKNPSNLK
jgi:hypothetical protein